MIGPALALLVGACGPATADHTYRGLVARGVGEGRDGRRAAAAETLGRAIALCPARPEAWVERGGLRFLEGRYPDAVEDLERALRLREDAYARDLLASALHLARRPEEAIARWNALGKPLVGAVTITGLTHTRDDVVRRELSLEPGVLLTVPRLRASGRRLREVGVFPRVALRPTPRGDGTADVEAALTELHGLAASPLEFVVTTGTYLLQRRARLQYANLGGEGITAVAEHRFEDHRPETSVGLSWPRPLGLPAYLRLRGWRGRQDYAVDTAMLRERSRGATVSLRRVFTARAVGQLSLRLAHLSGVASEGGGEGAWDGRLLGAEAGLDGSLVQTRRHRLETLVRAAGSGGAGRSYLRGSGGLRYYAHLGAPEDEGMGASVLAAQTRVGAAGRPAPLADRFALGVSPEMELPLRGRFRAPDGIQDGRLLARSFVLHNLEWRRRVVRATGLQAGIVLFHDGARLAGVAGERPRWLHDVGGGVRLAVAGGPLLRVDYGRGLTDGRQSVSFGLDQAF